jgi:hypothetical protein
VHTTRFNGIDVAAKVPDISLDMSLITPLFTGVWWLSLGLEVFFWEFCLSSKCPEGH